MEEGQTKVMFNINYTQGDIKHIKPPVSSFLVCIHGCNEANLCVLKISKEKKAGWAVMPCCIRDGMYGPNFHSVDDDSRHALACGIIVGINNALKVSSINKLITNRNIIIMGDNSIK